MRRLPGYSIAFVLAVLLLATTPVGTGVGLHQLELVHPLFSHLHIVDGRMMTHQQMEQSRLMPAPAERATPRGPAFGAGAGSGPQAGGIGLSPTLPAQLTAPVWLDVRVTWPRIDLSVPAGRNEAPPDPPPLP
jgi:hypothetical protein